MSSVTGLGTDIIEVSRIQKAIERQGQKLLDRLFSAEEQAYCRQHKNPYPSFAARFAAKEATSKAFGTGIGEVMNWLDVEIIKDEKGKPELLLSHKLREQFPKVKLLLTMSHCSEYATATVLLLSD